MRIGTLQRLGIAAVVALATAGIAAGCGSSSSSSTSGTTGELTATPGIADISADQKVASLVPSDIESKGTLSVAADATYPPDEYIQKGTKTVIGADADLAKALAAVMGLDADVQNVTFDSIIPGLAANKYDLGMSSFTITLEREQTVDFVSYLSAGTSFYVKTDGGPDITSLADLCGYSVAVERGTTQETDAEAQSKKCTQAGDEAVDVGVYPDQNGANLAISSGKADVGMADSPPAAYIVEQSNGQFKLSGEPYGAADYGIAMPKDSGLDKPVEAGMQALIDDGTYSDILDYWGLQQGAIETAEIDPTDVPKS
jgi:polar amino acid transport system substrate-binding protein